MVTLLSAEGQGRANSMKYESALLFGIDREVLSDEQSVFAF